MAIGNITATHGCESQMWLRQMRPNTRHVLFKYCPFSLLDFRMETTAVRLHRAWMEPVASLLWGLGWWKSQSRLAEQGGTTGLQGMATEVEGVCWAPVGCCSASPATWRRLRRSAVC